MDRATGDQGCEDQRPTRSADRSPAETMPSRECDDVAHAKGENYPVWVWRVQEHAVTLPAAVLSFAVVAGLLTVIPGLDTALVLRAAITQGRRQGFATALGINTGALVWGAGAAVGVSALLTASTIAAVPATAWGSWRRGLLTNLLNPKIGAFYVAVLHQFIPTGTSHLAVGLLLALVHDVDGMLWFTAII